MADGDGLPVAVIGAGGSGILAAIALRRAGLPFEICEARDGVGGTWRYDPDGDGSACYESLVTNTSRLRTSPAAKRIPGRPWQYVPHAEMLAYFEDLTDRFDLRRNLRLNWKVAQAARDESEWVLHNDAGEVLRCRAVVCALGVNGRPRTAPLRGTFTGEQMHSAGYREPTPFAGKDVLVIGLGTSGCEIAGELAGTARSVRVAVRSPSWTMTRRWAGVPLDWLDNPMVARVVPWRMRRSFLAATSRLTTGRLHRHGRPRPTRRCGDDVIAVSDSFPRAVRAGLVEFRADVLDVGGRTVRFADHTSADVDVIVHATGFDLPTEFLPQEFSPGVGGLYRGIAHPEADGLFFVGLIEAHRALLPIAEQQAIWTAAVLSGQLALPRPSERRRVASQEAKRRLRDFGDRREFLVDYAKYLATLRRDRRAGGPARITTRA
jgi:hypothetical protein